MPEPLSREALQRYMQGSPFIREIGMQVTAADHERETLTMVLPLKADLERAEGSGQFHGGPIAALIDTAGCFALVMLLGGPVPTVNFRTDYLRPAIDTSLRAEAMVRRVGRTVGVVDVDVFDDSDRLVAVGRGTFGSQGG